jgi:hypothetical protein
MTELEHTGKAQHELDHTVQSKKTLLKATAFASLLAVIVFFVAILPAEFGIDPTGLGNLMGLTQLSGQVPVAQATIPQADTIKQSIVWILAFRQEKDWSISFIYQKVMPCDTVGQQRMANCSFLIFMENLKAIQQGILKVIRLVPLRLRVALLPLPLTALMGGTGRTRGYMTL